MNVKAAKEVFKAIPCENFSLQISSIPTVKCIMMIHGTQYLHLQIAQAYKNALSQWMKKSFLITL